MDGHASNAPETLSDLASFLGDTPEQESQDEDVEALADESTDELDTDESETVGQEESDDGEPSEDEEAEDTPAPDRKIKVPVKGDDGTDQEIEVDESELVKSYLRQSDYTKKTQELAHREHQAVENLKAKHDEFVNNYVQKAEASRAAIVQLAGLRSEAEMAQLAQSDPAAWVAENQRQQTIVNFINQMDRDLAAEREQVAQRQQAEMQQVRAKLFQESWEALQKDGIDREKLAKAYGDASKVYGFTQEELASVLDHRYVRVLMDGLKYRELQNQKQTVKQKVDVAPKLQAKTPNGISRADRELEKRFSSGRAKLNDLAALLR